MILIIIILSCGKGHIVLEAQKKELFRKKDVWYRADYLLVSSLQCRHSLL